MSSPDQGIPPPSQPPPPLPPRVETQSVATMTSLTETPCITLSPTNANTPAATTVGPSAVTSAAPFQHLSRTSYMQKLGLNPTSATASPGGPGSSAVGGGCSGGVGAIRRTGPTVQSLIQTIENQVITFFYGKLKSA